MKISIISDIHVTDKEDVSFSLLLSFLNEQKKQCPDTIILLGDIFDVMAGYHKSYFEKYEEIFSSCAELISQGITIYYFEGNHDMHLEKLVAKAAIKFNFDCTKFIVERKYKVISDNDNSLYFAHGDELEGDDTYLSYKNIIHSSALKLFADYILPYKILELVAGSASKKSRGLNYQKYSSEEEKEKIKLRYRNIAKEVERDEGCHFIFLGHSHYKDLYNSDGMTYGNCGYVSATRSYLFYDNGEVNFVTIK